LPLRILNSYIIKDFIITFLIALGIFLFVLAIGNIFKVIDLFSRGISALFILKVFAYNIPYSLIFAIPMSVLAASFLLFSRLTNDLEIVALKACGVSLWQILQPLALIAVILTIICIYINCSLAPYCHFARRTTLGELGMVTPLSLLDEGRFVRELPGLTIYIGRKDGNKVQDVIVYEFGDEELSRTVRAKSGDVIFKKHPHNKLLVTLYDVRIDQVDQNAPDDLSKVKHLTAAEYPISINVADLMMREVIWKKLSDYTMVELMRGISGVVLFMPGEFLNIQLLASKLRNPDTSLSSFIRSKLPDELKNTIDNYDLSTSPPKYLARDLAETFNNLILTEQLYQPERFKDINIPSGITNLLSQKLTGSSRIQLRRKLLENAYPHAISENPISKLNYEDKMVYKTSLMVEASSRLSLSLCCFAFLLLGMALGIKIHRKESSVGIILTLLLVFIFYFFIIIAESLVTYPETYPYIIVWFPFVVSEIIGFAILRKAT
jgi:lipopolysaccharide export LptBFGC system permease protein LptF